MAITNNASVKQNNQETQWKKVSIPDSKVALVWTDAKSGRTSMAFEVGDTTGCKGLFFVGIKQVHRNADRTGYIVDMPERPVTITERIQNGKEVEKKTYTAEHLNDLGFPIE